MYTLSMYGPSHIKRILYLSIQRSSLYTSSMYGPTHISVYYIYLYKVHLCISMYCPSHNVRILYLSIQSSSMYTSSIVCMVQLIFPYTAFIHTNSIYVYLIYGKNKSISNKV